MMNCFMRISETFELLMPPWFPMLGMNHFDVRCAMDKPQIASILKPGVNDVIFNIQLLPPTFARDYIYTPYQFCELGH